MTQTRRDFLKTLATATGAAVLVPLVHACATPASSGPDARQDASPAPTPTGQPSPPPQARPQGWDPVAYNRERGQQGAIPDAYMKDINGPDGVPQHLGKHLPYVPSLEDTSIVPAGFLPLMWGDPSKGFAKHPNAPRQESNNHEGHWYNWIKLRKATDDQAQELQSTYTDWPGTTDEATGRYAVFAGDDLTADAGKNTIYLAALPEDVKPGDTVRVWAHCLTHGEYVDFITV